MLVNRKKEILSQTQISISDLKELFDTNLEKARLLSKEIRENNAEFYNSPIYKATCVSPVHVLPYLGITKDEYFKFIFKDE